MTNKLHTKRVLIMCIVSVISIAVSATNILQYETCVLSDNIRTLRVKYADNDNIERPFLTLGSDEQLEISFDELSHNTHNYTYTILHLNANRTQSNLHTSEYISGFTTQYITDYAQSLNTTQLYTHYSFVFPNEDMKLTASGNYAIKIFEDGDQENVVAYVCFSVAEPISEISCNIRGNTDIEFSGKYQQLDIDVQLGDMNIVNPASEIKVLVRQNGRTDNEILCDKPTYIESHRLRYINQKQLIFEGNNEYRHFDISSVYFKGNNVDRIYFDHALYHAYLYPDEVKSGNPYLTEYDANGQYVIHSEKVQDDDTEADYMWVHFLLPTSSPWFTGGVYVSGDLTYNCFTQSNRMQYDNQHETYYLSLFLKQGAYDYQYLLLDKTTRKASAMPAEGSHWQTQNEYTIYVFYHPFGARADRLIGVKTL